MLNEAERQLIRLRWVPTWVPQPSPIEKLWRWCRQVLLHHHRRADDHDGLKAVVGNSPERFLHDSDELFRYTGR